MLQQPHGVTGCHRLHAQLPVLAGPDVTPFPHKLSSIKISASLPQLIQSVAASNRNEHDQELRFLRTHKGAGLGVRNPVWFDAYSVQAHFTMTQVWQCRDCMHAMLYHCQPF